MGGKHSQHYYRLLHVQPDAPTEAIKASYRTLLRTLKHHPDLGSDALDAALINEAYAVLSNPEKRKRYDREQERPEDGAGRDNPETAQSVGPARTESVDSRVCAFCKTVNNGNVQTANESCSECWGRGAETCRFHGEE